MNYINNLLPGILKKYVKIFLTIFFIISPELIQAETSINKPEEEKETINLTISVYDKSTNEPLQSVVVLLQKDNSIIAKGNSNPFGRVVLDDIEEGDYTLLTHYIGYNEFKGKISVDSLHRYYEIKLSEKNLELDEVVVSGERINKVSTSIDINTGRQTFEGETYHAAPLNSITQLVQENLAGAAKASTGEVHIRGQHGEFSYLVDGIPIPLGVFGGLNEIVDPKVIARITFFTGGFPAEYGGQISGLMDIQNRVPTGKFHLDLSTFAGSYLTSADSLGEKVGNFKALNSNGQSISFSDHIGKIGYFIAASRQETDRRIDQPVEKLFHDKGTDYFTYAKLDYLMNENDYLTANFNFSKTQTQVPYDSVEGYNADDQNSYNAFQTLSYFHTISAMPDNEENFFIGAFAREGGLRFIPNVYDDNQIYLGADSLNSYVIDQKRRFGTFGLRTKYEKSLSHQLKFSAGANYSYTIGNENFRFYNANRNALINNSNYKGYDAGIFTQFQLHPVEWGRIDAGIRYDIHNAPSIKNQFQLSPRIKLFFFMDEYNSFSLSYDKLFMPTNIENLGAIASVTGNDASATLPEKDNLYEAAFTRIWSGGFTSKLAGFYKEASPGLDDETLGSSTIKVNVNINKVKITGLEFALTYNDGESPFSGYINAALTHAYGEGPVSGGFLPATRGTEPFDLDHDQRLSTVFGLNYQPDNWFVNLSTNYSSGLANGKDDFAFKTGLFDFNQASHTTPSWILNISSGYTFNLKNGQSIEPSLYVTNLLDHDHLIKGVFFSGAALEERRNIMLKISYHL